MLKHRNVLNRLMARRVDLWVAVLAALITAGGTVLAAYLTVCLPRGNRDAAPKVGTVAMKSPSVAEFPGTDEYPRNSYNYEWKVFNDSKYLGNSLVWYEALERADRNNDNFLRVYVTTGDRSRLPYCGLYTDFSCPPYKCVDASPYRGIEFEARWLPEPGASKLPAFLVQVAVLGVESYAYHEARFQVTPGDPQFRLVRVSFADLETPSYVDREYDFDPKRIFRVGFTVKGKNVKGKLDLDGIRFFK